MKFILNKDTLKIENKDLINSGSVNYYEADVEYDESWNNLTIKAVLVKNGEEEGKEIAVIGNKVFLDKEEFGSHCIGFVGYTIENEEKVYQVSTNLESFYIQRGAGEVETEQTQIPTPTEWEKYIAQIEEMLKNAGGGYGGITEETDPTVPQHVKDITQEDIEKWNNNSGGGGINEIYVGEYEPTDEDVEVWIDITEEAEEIPTKTSELENDSGFITEIPEEYAKKTDIPDISNFVTEEFVNTAIQNALEVVENGTY